MLALSLAVGAGVVGAPAPSAVVFIRDRLPRGGASTLQRLDIATGDVRRLAAPGVRIKDFAVAPDGTIAFVGAYRRYGTVRVFSEGDDRSYQIHGVNDETIRGLAYNPQGTRIVYAGARLRDGRPVEGTSELYSMQASGKQVSRLTHDKRDDLTPVVTPDGERIVFSRSGRNGLDLRSMPIGGGGMRRVTSTKGDEFAPSVSPDGRRVAYTRGGARSSVEVIDTDGGNRVPAGGAGRDDSAFSPAWSPDGARIAFVSDRATRMRGRASRFQLFSVRADGTGVERLLDSAFSDSRPAYAP